MIFFFAFSIFLSYIILCEMIMVSHLPYAMTMTVHSTSQPHLPEIHFTLHTVVCFVLLYSFWLVLLNGFWVGLLDGFSQGMLDGSMLLKILFWWARKRTA
jgi:hypothetical protein